MTEKKRRGQIVGDGLLRLGEAEKFLAVSRYLLYELMDRGDLPFVMVGKRRRIPRKALMDYAQKNLVLAESVAG